MVRPLALALALLAALLAVPAWIDPGADAQDAQDDNLLSRVFILENKVEDLEADALPPRTKVDVRTGGGISQPPFDPTYAFGLYCIIRTPVGSHPLMTESAIPDQYVVACVRPTADSTLDFPS